MERERERERERESVTFMVTNVDCKVQTTSANMSLEYLSGGGQFADERWNSITSVKSIVAQCTMTSPLFWRWNGHDATLMYDGGCHVYHEVLHIHESHVATEGVRSTTLTTEHVHEESWEGELLGFKYHYMFGKLSVKVSCLLMEGNLQNKGC
jgi:hypothetical protein